MIETLHSLDTELFLFLNGLHTDWLDPIMLFVSKSVLQIFFIAFAVLIYGLIKIKKKIFLAFLFCLLSIGTSDFISSGIFKPTFERLRPCRVPELKKIVHKGGQGNRCFGGKYGFVSSHASNSFCFALFMVLVFGSINKFFYLLFPYAGLVSYSRIYLAKHYPGDILAGTVIGLIVAWLGFKLYQLTLKKLNWN